MASSSVHGYLCEAAGSSLPGGPEVSFAEPMRVAFYRPGIQKHWTGKPKRLKHTRNALRGFFRETPDRKVYHGEESLHLHHGQCNVVSLYRIGSHEYGLQSAGKELIPFAFRGGMGASAKQKGLLPCRGVLVSSCCLHARLGIPHKTRPTRPRYGRGGGGQGHTLVNFHF